MINNLDYYGKQEIPHYVLCKANGERIGILNCTSKKYTRKFNDYDEISFTIYRKINNELNQYYDNLIELQYIELPEIGRFVINGLDTKSEGTEFEYKDCTALSEEVLLAQKYLEVFLINQGTTGSIDGVQFYNLQDPEKSLLHLTLEKCPDWTIGHVDTELMSMQRSFEIDRQDVYSTLINDYSEAFECIFEFDTINHIINVYTEENVGEDTEVFITYDNLLKNTNISSSIDDIKTCLTVTGSDDLNLREVNMGEDRIYNIDYFHSLEYMSQELYDAYKAWKDKWEANVEAYSALSIEYQNYYKQIHEIESERMPDDPDSENWEEYGLNPLNEKLEICEQKQAVMIKAGWGSTDSKYYVSHYLPLYNKIEAIKGQIEAVKIELDIVKGNQESAGQQMQLILNEVSMQNNFTQKQLLELTKFIREDELSSDNYVVTDTMTEEERMEMLRDMLKFGQKELAKVSQPTLDFSSDMVNLFTIPEFQGITDKFDVGNYIHIGMRDDYIVKARLLSMDINFYDNNDFKVTFGNVAKKKGSKILSDITEALKLAQSAATSVSFNSSYWNQANKEASETSQMIAEGLLAAGKGLVNSQSDIIVDDRGMFIKNTPESEYPNDIIFLGNSQILFSDDNLKTIKTGLGRLTYTKKGTRYNDFGLMANFVISGFISGTVIEGNEIIAGSITGTSINNGNDTFSVDKDGNLTATSATVKGSIYADVGKIGGDNGFTIESGKIYSGTKSTFQNTESGVYLGTDGICLGSNFYVDSLGNLYASRGKFGLIEVSAGGTSLNANAGFSLSDTALSQFDTLVCRNITAENVQATNVLAGYVTTGYLTANYMTASAISTNYITASAVSTNYATIARVEALEGNFSKINAYVTTSGNINAYHIEAELITIKTNQGLYMLKDGVEGRVTVGTDNTLKWSSLSGGMT